MSTDQRCGTCGHLIEFPGYETYHCRWTECRLLLKPVDKDDGRTCPTWQAKEKTT